MPIRRLFSRRGVLALGASAAAGAVLAACQTPPAVEVTKVVTSVVETERVVEKPVEITQVVEREVPVEVTVVEQVPVEVTVIEQVEVTAAAPARTRVDVIWYNDWFVEGARSEMMVAAMEIFKQEHPTIFVNPIASDSWQPIGRWAAADNMPDLGMFGLPSDYRTWQEENIFQDVTPLLQARNYADLADEFADINLDKSYFMFEGKVYGLPWEYSNSDWAVNRTLLENHGIEVPDSKTWTYDDLVELGLQVTDPEQNIWGVVFDEFGQFYFWLGAVYAAGGKDLSEDGRQILFTEGPAVDAWQALIDWVHKWKIAPSPQQSEELGPSFGMGTVAAHGNWIARPGYGAEEQNLEAVQMLPPIWAATGGRASIGNGNADAITTWAEKRGVLEETVDLGIFGGSPTVDKLKMEFPVEQEPIRKSSFQDPAFAPEETRAVLAESAQYRRDFTMSVVDTNWTFWTIAEPHVNAMLRGEISVKEGLAKIKRRATKPSKPSS